MEQTHEDKKNVAKAEKTAGARFDGSVHISDDVLVELTKKTILTIPHIQTANTSIASKFGIGRKSGDGVRVSVEEGNVPTISVDAYILVKYGQRIPDLAWDVQEKIKANLERYTGYTVKTVNINVQGIYLDEPLVPEESTAECCSKEQVSEAGKREN